MAEEAAPVSTPAEGTAVPAPVAPPTPETPHRLTKSERISQAQKGLAAFIAKQEPAAAKAPPPPSAPEPAAEAEDIATDEPGEEELDPRDKRLAALRQREKHSRDSTEQFHAEKLGDLQGRVAAFEKEWGPRVEKATKWEGLLAQAKHDPIVLADALTDGLDAEARAQLAHQMWIEAKGDLDPKTKEQAKALRREREARLEAKTKTEGTSKEMAELRAELAAHKAELAVESLTTKFTSAISDKQPLLKALVARKPEFVQDRIRSATAYLREKTGKSPDAADVLDSLEALEKQELSSRGLDPFQALGIQDSATKPKPTPAGETKTAPTPTAKPPEPKPSSNQVVSRLTTRRQAAIALATRLESEKP